MYTGGAEVQTTNLFWLVDDPLYPLSHTNNERLSVLTWLSCLNLINYLLMCTNPTSGKIKSISISATIMQLKLCGKYKHFNNTARFSTCYHFIWITKGRVANLFLKHILSVEINFTDKSAVSSCQAVGMCLGADGRGWGYFQGVACSHKL